jgi:hypothetical protein
MTTDRQFADSEGDFKEWYPTERHCHWPDCEEPVRFREWESFDGAYVDVQYRCAAGHVSWVDGIDS